MIGNRNTSYPSKTIDRSRSLILFGLPESPLKATKSALDEISESNHLIGKTFVVQDTFHLGRKPTPPSSDSSTTSPVYNSCPHPLLIKCGNAWDRRLLLAARRELKSFDKFKLYLREDLPPDARSPKGNSACITGGAHTVDGILPPHTTDNASSSNSTSSQTSVSDTGKLISNDSQSF